MQKIIDNITSGEWNQKQLLAALVDYHEKNCNEYEIAVDQVEIRNNEICVLKKDAEMNIEIKAGLNNARLEAIENVKAMQSDNIILKAQLADYKEIKKTSATQYKKIGVLTKTNKNLVTRNEKLVKDNKAYRATVSEKESDVARLRLTGHKQIGKYSFHLFPSKVKMEMRSGKVQKQINIMVMNKDGAMKIIGVDETDEINQPKSHTFKFDDEQAAFIKAFSLVAKQDNWQFTDRVLSMVN